MKSQSGINSLKQNSGYLFLVFLLYLFNPVLGILLNSYIVIKTNTRKRKDYYVLMLLISIYLGLISSTKIPENDLAAYFDLFNSVPEKSMLDFILMHDKEYVFYLLTYILFYAFGGMFNVYVLFVVALGYFIFLVSIYTYYQQDIEKGSLICFLSLIFISFLDLYFNWTGHLLRQILAGCFFIYFVIHKYLYNKDLWWIALVAVLIHSSVLILFIIIVIIDFSGVNKKFSIRNIFKLTLVFLVILLLFKLLFGFLYSLTGSIGVLNSLFEQINAGPIVDSAGADATSGVWPVVFLLLMMVLSVFIMMFYELEKYEKSLIILFIVYFVYSFYLFMSEDYLLSYRMNIYSYLFYPFLFFLPFKYLGDNAYGVFVKSFYFIVIFITIVRFYRFLAIGTWVYAPLDNILLFPVVSYFF